MSLYVLRRRNADAILYDIAYGFVVRADNAREARALAASQAGDEGAEHWLDASQSSCRTLVASGKAEVILRDFNAG